MRMIHISEITSVVEELCIESNCCIADDILNAMTAARVLESSTIGDDALEQLVQNAHIAKESGIAICQDTGIVVVFVDVGQDVHIVGGNIANAINEGVRRGYKKGYLRNSIVKDPFIRVNTSDNTPAVIHYDIVDGDKIKIAIMPKGFGSENTSKVGMLKPNDGEEGVRKFILNVVEMAGSNACPPMIIGVGIGGTIELAALLSKKALLRPIHVHNELPHIEKLEKEILKQINLLGIGPCGFGGRTTALGVNIEVFPTHIAGLPVAVNTGCHATRHKERVI